MHWKLGKHGRVFYANNQLWNKSHVELDDNSIVDFKSGHHSSMMSSHVDVDICPDDEILLFLQVLRILNPPQEEDWLYGQARRGQEVPTNSCLPPALSSCRGNPNDLPFPGIPQLEHIGSSKSSSSTCSQSEASIGSHSDTTSQSETESLSHLQSSSPSMKATKSRKSKWKLLKDKVGQDNAIV